MKTSHPKILPALCLTEMWERFGYYTVQGLLVLYMSKAFGFTDNDSYTIMGVFSALAYISPFVGGSLADRLLGFKNAVVWGGLFLCAGYAMLAFAGPRQFYLSLATIVVGNGLFKPNISSLLGALYEPGDPKRESGFTIFYIGINVGALLSSIFSGLIKDHFGWHTAFGLASIGLIFGLVIFIFSLKKMIDLKRHQLEASSQVSKLTQGMMLFGALISIGLISLLLRSTLLAKWFLPAMGAALLVFLLVLILKQEAQDRRRLLTLTILILSSIVFWMLFLQMFFSANLFIDRLVDRQVSAFTIPILHKMVGPFIIPTTVFYGLESVFVMILGPAFAWSWQTLSYSNKNPSPFLKFILSIGFAGLCFFTLGLGTHYAYANHLVSPFWFLLSYLFLTIGELLLSPIGLSAVTTLAPRKWVGMMMGVWFVATGFGGQFAGWLAQLSNIPQSITSLDAQLAIYRHAFMDFAYIAFGIMALLFVIYLFLRKLFPTEQV
jgi:POT family proton-dependent oligopeptide transporter